MNEQRARRLLIVAFALSLVIHVLFAAGIRWRISPSDEAPQTIEQVRVTHLIHIARAVPTPARPPSPRPAPSVSRLKRPANVASNGGHGVAHVAQAPTPAPAQIPSAAPSQTPGCTKLDMPATIAATPPPPDIAPAARADAVSGTAEVNVTLDSTGAVTNAQILHSSGSGSLDLVAVDLAKSARYAPATHDCKAVASSNVVFTARFYAW